MTQNQQYADFFKNFANWKPPVDFDGLVSTQRRNIEAISTAGQVVAEGIQAVARRQAEVTRSNVEDFLKASKELFTNASPEQSAAKQADFAKNVFESALNNLREVSEMVTKSSYEAFDVLNKRTAESLEEFSRVANKKNNK